MINFTGLLQQYSQYSIIGISFIITLAMTLVTKYFTNQKRMKELKDTQKDCQKKLKEHKDNPKELEKIQKEMMSSSMELMKHSFKPMLITTIPLLLVLFWIRSVYEGVLVGWIWWYIISSVIFSIVLRKLLKVV